MKPMTRRGILTMMNHPTIAAMTAEAHRADLMREVQQTRPHQTACNFAVNEHPNITTILNALLGFKPQALTADMPTLTGESERISTS
jgi:hypothetical protein